MAGIALMLRIVPGTLNLIGLSFLRAPVVDVEINFDLVGGAELIAALVESVMWCAGGVTWFEMEAAWCWIRDWFGRKFTIWEWLCHFWIAYIGGNHNHLFTNINSVFVRMVGTVESSTYPSVSGRGVNLSCSKPFANPRTVRVVPFALFEVHFAELGTKIGQFVR